MTAPKKYDAECARIKLETGAPGVLLVIFHAHAGELVLACDPEFEGTLVGRLRKLADRVEQSGIGPGKAVPVMDEIGPSTNLN